MPTCRYWDDHGLSEDLVRLSSDELLTGYAEEPAGFLDGDQVEALIHAEVARLDTFVAAPERELSAHVAALSKIKARGDEAPGAAGGAGSLRRRRGSLGRSRTGADVLSSTAAVFVKAEAEITDALTLVARAHSTACLAVQNVGRADLIAGVLNKASFFTSPVLDELLCRVAVMIATHEDTATGSQSPKTVAAGKRGASADGGKRGHEQWLMPLFFLAVFLGQMANHGVKVQQAWGLVMQERDPVAGLFFMGLTTLMDAVGTIAGSYLLSRGVGSRAIPAWVLLVTVPIGRAFCVSMGAYGLDGFLRGVFNSARHVAYHEMNARERRSFVRTNSTLLSCMECAGQAGPLLLWLAQGSTLFQSVLTLFFTASAAAFFLIYAVGDVARHTADRRASAKTHMGVMTSIRGVADDVERKALRLPYAAFLLMQAHRLRVVLAVLAGMLASHHGQDPLFATALCYGAVEMGGVIGAVVQSSDMVPVAVGSSTLATPLVMHALGTLAIVAALRHAMSTGVGLLIVLLMLVFGAFGLVSRVVVLSHMQEQISTAYSSDLNSITRFLVKLVAGLAKLLVAFWVYATADTNARVADVAYSTASSLATALGGLAIIQLLLAVALVQTDIVEHGKRRRTTVDEDSEGDADDAARNRARSRVTTVPASDELDWDDADDVDDVEAEGGMRNLNRRFVVFEGPDGAGKSTQAKALMTDLQARGYTVLMTAWSSPKRCWSSIRAAKRLPVMRNGLILVMQAMDLRQLMEEEVVPALRDGKAVIMDRYFYTGIARGIARGYRAGWLETLFGADDPARIHPKLVCYFSCPAEVAVHRVMMRSMLKNADGSDDECGSDDEADAEGQPAADGSEVTRVSRYEAGLDLALSTDVRENFTTFHRMVIGNYDAMVDQYGFGVVQGEASRDEQRRQVARHARPLFGDDDVAEYDGFWRDPRQDNATLHKSYTDPVFGLHTYFRSMYIEVQVRLNELLEPNGSGGVLSSAPRVLLHGNPHVCNYSKYVDECGMVDFDRSRYGPFWWDFVRLWISTSLYQVPERASNELLDQSVMQAFLRGYREGFSDPEGVQIGIIARLADVQPAEHEQSVAAYLAARRRRAKELLTNLVAEDEDEETWEQAREFVRMYDAKLFASHVIEHVSQSWNWRFTRGRTMVVMASKDDPEDKQLLEFKPAIIALSEAEAKARDWPDDTKRLWDKLPTFYSSPFADDGDRMRTAAEVYLDVSHERMFIINGLAYMGRPVPLFNAKITSYLKIQDQADLLYRVGQQLGRGHARTVRDSARARVLPQIAEHLERVVHAADQIKSELTVGYRRYINALSSFD